MTFIQWWRILQQWKTATVQSEANIMECLTKAQEADSIQDRTIAMVVLEEETMEEETLEEETCTKDEERMVQTKEEEIIRQGNSLSQTEQRATVNNSTRTIIRKLMIQERC